MVVGPDSFLSPTHCPRPRHLTHFRPPRDGHFRILKGFRKGGLDAGGGFPPPGLPCPRNKLKSRCSSHLPKTPKQRHFFFRTRMKWFFQINHQHFLLSLCLIAACGILPGSPLLNVRDVFLPFGLWVLPIPGVWISLPLGFQGVRAGFLRGPTLL